MMYILHRLPYTYKLLYDPYYYADRLFYTQGTQLALNVINIELENLVGGLAVRTYNHQTYYTYEIKLLRILLILILGNLQKLINIVLVDQKYYRGIVNCVNDLHTYN